MYVVRVENDEAVMYRAFRRFQSAKIWAAERDAEHVECLIDILDAADTDDMGAAVNRARKGDLQSLLRAESLTMPPRVAPAGSDIEFGQAYAV